MSVIDVHAHFISQQMVEAVAATSTTARPVFVEDEHGRVLQIGAKKRIGPMPEAVGNAALRIDDMDRQGVDVQLLAVPPMLFGYEQEPEVSIEISRAVNLALIDTASRCPDRFQVLGNLPMQDPAASVEEARLLATEPLVRGVQVGSHVEDRNLDEPMFEPVWQALEELDLAVLIHPYAMAGVGGLRRYYLGNLVGNPAESTVAIAALIFGGVLERHPRLRFVFVHGGGFAPYQIGRWDHGWKWRPEAREHIDRPPSEYLGRLYFDSLTLDPLSLELLGRRVGWDHVVLGTDHPFDMSEPDPIGALRALGLPTADEERVLSLNAEVLLRPMAGGREAFRASC
jgi:aminocarboxymuconate-semialdehyde decarboxylase